jgi:acyl-CoA synthetase (AMP-forming)/AMP-acid ligase II
MSDTRFAAPEKLVSFVDAVLFHAAKAPNSPAIGLESGVPCPRCVVFAEIPKTSTGKIQKFKLREMAKAV